MIEMESYEPKTPKAFMILMAIVLFLLGYAVCFFCVIVNQDYSPPNIEKYENVENATYNTDSKEVVLTLDNGDRVILR